VEAANNPLGSDIVTKLSELGSAFNTNPKFGLEGVIEGNELRARAEVETAKPAIVETRSNVPVIDDKVFQDVINPLNTSIQQTKQEFRGALDRVTSAINELKSGQRPDVVAEDVDPVTHQTQALRNEMAQLQLNSAYDRAVNSLNAFKAKNPGFDWTEQNIRELWQTRIGNNVDLARNTDWDTYFQMNHDAKDAVRQRQQNEELKAKIASLESGRNSVRDLAATPRSSSNTISMAKPDSDSGINEELYQRANNRMGKGRFMGYGRILQEEQTKMQLAGKI
jgi:BMFP domain-containing protein YqiC